MATIPAASIGPCNQIKYFAPHTETAAYKRLPKDKMTKQTSFWNLGQFNGSFGSSEGCGARTI